jgi:glycosyltransferase involved in cell wall biosynthesis
MSKSPHLISICIPAYKRPANIERLLYSISIQTFKDYEIIISDDSPDDSLQAVLQKYGQLPIVYYKNGKSLGTPANWNYGISLAKGEWIKIMHDDDWFASEKSLQGFADETKKGSRFIVCRYFNVFESGEKEQPAFPEVWKNKIIRQPMTLLARNVIGPPSVTLVHSSVKEQYDIGMKWRVDMDYYVRILSEQKSFGLIDEPLINVGIGESQVTNYCIDQPEVELPEGLLLLYKYGIRPLNNILVYDAWWRILRNVNIRKAEQLKSYTPNKEWPEAILKIVNHQSIIAPSLLRFGPFSKLAMTLSYLLNQRYLKN